MEHLPNGYEMREIIKNTDLLTLQDYLCCIKKEVEERRSQASENHCRRIVVSIQNALDNGMNVYFCPESGAPIQIKDSSAIEVYPEEDDD